MSISAHHASLITDHRSRPLNCQNRRGLRAGGAGPGLVHRQACKRAGFRNTIRRVELGAKSRELQLLSDELRAFLKGEDGLDSESTFLTCFSLQPMSLFYFTLHPSAFSLRHLFISAFSLQPMNLLTSAFSLQSMNLLSSATAILERFRENAEDVGVNRLVLFYLFSMQELRCDDATRLNEILGMRRRGCYANRTVQENTSV